MARIRCLSSPNLYHCSLNIVYVKLHFGIKDGSKLANPKSVSDADVVPVYLLVVLIYRKHQFCEKSLRELVRGSGFVV